MEHVAENGYDTSKFNKYFSEKFNANLNVDSMSFQQVQDLVEDFKQLGAELEEWDDLAVFDKQFQGKDFAKPFSRETLLTRKIDGVHQTEINIKATQIQVTQYKVIKGGVWSTDFVQFQIETKIPGQQFKYLVQRKDSDFFALRRSLVARYPYVIVPALPSKSTATSESEAQKRQQMYNRFLTGINRSEVLKSSKFLMDFLKLAERKDWKFNKKLNEKLKFSRKIEDVINVEGQVNVVEQKNAVAFCSKVKTMADQYSSLTKDAINLSREVHQRSGQLASIINKLAECFEGLGKFNKKLKIPSQAKLFTKLSGLYYSQSLNLQNQGELTKIYCGQAMKYYEQELQPIEELLSFRDSFKLDYMKQLEKLTEKKSALFGKEFSQWEYNGTMDELISRSRELKDRKEAYKFMLSTETQRLHEVSEELNFYTNQCLEEPRRVGKDNGDALIEHFMDQAKIQQDYIEKQKEKWEEFVDYFGSFKWERVKKKEKQKVSKARKPKQKSLDDFEVFAEPSLADDSLYISKSDLRDEQGYQARLPPEHRRSTQDTREKQSTIAESFAGAAFDWFDGPDSPSQTKVKFSQERHSVIQINETQQVVKVRSAEGTKSILKNSNRGMFSLIGKSQPKAEPLRQQPDELPGSLSFENILDDLKAGPTEEPQVTQRDKRNSFKQNRPSLGQEQVVDFGPSVTLPTAAVQLQEETKVDPDSVTQLTFKDLVEGNDLSMTDMSLLDESRQSIVQEVLDGTRSSILNRDQMDRLRFAESVAAQANKLVPIRNNLEVSAKVQAYLNQQTLKRPTVKINEQLKRQITKMISMRMEDGSEEEESASDFSSD